MDRTLRDGITAQSKTKMQFHIYDGEGKKNEADPV